MYLPDANILIAGDIVFFGRYPNIDFAYGGSIDGMIRGVDELIGFAKDDTEIVPGHGPAGTKALMKEYRQLLVEARDRIAKLKAAGKTEDEIVAAKPNDAKFGVDARHRKLHPHRLSLARQVGLAFRRPSSSSGLRDGCRAPGCGSPGPHTFSS